MKSTKKQNPKRDIKWSVVLPVVFSIFSVITSLVSIWQSNKAQNFVQEETQRQNFAFVRNSVYIAQSIDLKLASDVQSLENYCQHVALIKSDYWREILSQSHNDQTKYIFLVARNHGPGIAQNFNYSSMNWEPKNNTKAPSVLSGTGELQDWLNPGDCLALLVDTVTSYDDAKRLSDQANINFVDINFTITYEDMLNKPYKLQSSIVDGASISLIK